MAASIVHKDWGNELLVRLQPLWKEHLLCDTTIECKQKTILQAHSILLAAASPKLYSYFRNAEQGSYTLVTPDVPASVWQNVLSFVYQGRLEISEDELVSTYNFARKIEMHDYYKNLGIEIQARGLTLEQQEAFLNTCGSPVPSISPKVAIPASGATSPRIHVASPAQQPQPSIGSPHTGMTSPRLSPGIAAMPGLISLTQAQLLVQSGVSLAVPIQAPAQLATNPPLISGPNTEALPTAVKRSQEQVQSSSSVADASALPPPAKQPNMAVPPPTTETNAELTGVSGAQAVSDRYECPGCLQNFNRESALRKHQDDCKVILKVAAPTEIPPTQTPRGHQNVVSYKDFYTRETGSSGEKGSLTYKCNLCDKRYPQYQGLYNHLKNKHNDVVHTVAQANTRHFRPGQLVSPKSSASESKLLNKSASCPVCKKQFKSYAEMLNHQKETHKTGTTRRLQSEHQQAETETKDDDSVSQFTCDQCSMKFKRKMHLAKHLKTHERASDKN